MSLTFVICLALMTTSIGIAIGWLLGGKWNQNDEDDE
jgi:hypothetical protein